MSAALTSGWFFKAGPGFGDKDKRDTFARKLKMAGGAIRGHLQSLKLGKGNVTKRFFVLEGTDFNYYMDESMDRLMGTIDLSRVTEVDPEDKKPMVNAIRLVSCCPETSLVAPRRGSGPGVRSRVSAGPTQVTAERTYTISPEAARDRSEWIAVLSSVVQVRSSSCAATGSAGLTRAGAGGAQEQHRSRRGRQLPAAQTGKRTPREKREQRDKESKAKIKKQQLSLRSAVAVRQCRRPPAEPRPAPRHPLAQLPPHARPVYAAQLGWSRGSRRAQSAGRQRRLRGGAQHGRGCGRRVRRR